MRDPHCTNRCCDVAGVNRNLVMFMNAHQAPETQARKPKLR